MEIAVGHLRFDHPELGEMAPGLGFLRPERWTATVDLAEGHDPGFHIELSTLGEVGGVTKIIDRKQRGRALAGRWGEDRRVEQSEPVAVEIVTAGPDRLAPHSQNGVLTRGA